MPKKKIIVEPKIVKQEEVKLDPFTVKQGTSNEERTTIALEALASQSGFVPNIKLSLEMRITLACEWLAINGSGGGHTYTFDDTDIGWEVYEDGVLLYQHDDKGQGSYTPTMFINAFNQVESNIRAVMSEDGKKLTLNANPTAMIDDKQLIGRNNTIGVNDPTKDINVPYDAPEISAKLTVDAITKELVGKTTSLGINDDTKDLNLKYDVSAKLASGDVTKQLIDNTTTIGINDESVDINLKYDISAKLATDSVTQELIGTTTTIGINDESKQINLEYTASAKLATDSVTKELIDNTTTIGINDSTKDINLEYIPPNSTLIEIYDATKSYEASTIVSRCGTLIRLNKPKTPGDWFDWYKNDTTRATALTLASKILPRFESGDVIPLARIQFGVPTVTGEPNGLWTFKFHYNDDTSRYATLQGYMQADYEEGQAIEFVVTSFDSDEPTLLVTDFGFKVYYKLDALTGNIALGFSYNPGKNIILMESFFAYASLENSCAAIEPSEFVTSDWTSAVFDIDFTYVEGIVSSDDRTTVTYDNNTGIATIDTSALKSEITPQDIIDATENSDTIDVSINPVGGKVIFTGKWEDHSYTFNETTDGWECLLDGTSIFEHTDKGAFTPQMFVDSFNDSQSNVKASIVDNKLVLNRSVETEWSQYTAINGAASPWVCRIGVIAFKSGISFEFLSNINAGDYDRNDGGIIKLDIETATDPFYKKQTIGNGLDIWYNVLSDKTVEIWVKIPEGGHRYIGYRSRSLRNGCWTPDNPIVQVDNVPDTAIQTVESGDDALRAIKVLDYTPSDGELVRDFTWYITHDREGLPSIKYLNFRFEELQEIYQILENKANIVMENIKLNEQVPSDDNWAFGHTIQLVNNSLSSLYMPSNTMVLHFNGDTDGTTDCIKCIPDESGLYVAQLIIQQKINTDLTVILWANDGTGARFGSFSPLYETKLTSVDGVGGPGSLFDCFGIELNKFDLIDAKLKTDIITINGDGTNYLTDDGTYKPISGQGLVDSVNLIGPDKDGNVTLTAENIPSESGSIATTTIADLPLILPDAKTYASFTTTIPKPVYSIRVFGKVTLHSETMNPSLPMSLSLCYNTENINNDKIVDAPQYGPGTFDLTFDTVIPFESLTNYENKTAYVVCGPSIEDIDATISEITLEYTFDEQYTSNVQADLDLLNLTTVKTTGDQDIAGIKTFWDLAEFEDNISVAADKMITLPKTPVKDFDATNKLYVDTQIADVVSSPTNITSTSLSIGGKDFERTVDLTSQTAAILTKADKIITTGDGNSFLADDGTYKSISGEGLVDSVNGQIGDVVLYAKDIKVTDDEDAITVKKSLDNLTDLAITSIATITNPDERVVITQTPGSRSIDFDTTNIVTNAGTVTSVDGVGPDKNGNVQISATDIYMNNKNTQTIASKIDEIDNMPWSSFPQIFIGGSNTFKIGEIQAAYTQVEYKYSIIGYQPATKDNPSIYELSILTDTDLGHWSGHMTQDLDIIDVFYSYKNLDTGFIEVWIDMKGGYTRARNLAFRVLCGTYVSAWSTGTLPEDAIPFDRDDNVLSVNNKTGVVTLNAEDILTTFPVVPNISIQTSLQQLKDSIDSKLDAVSHDSTLSGTGTKDSPLSVVAQPNDSIQIYDENANYPSGSFIARCNGIFRLNEDKPSGNWYDWYSNNAKPRNVTCISSSKTIITNIAQNTIVPLGRQTLQAEVQGIPMGQWSLRFIKDNSSIITLKGYLQNDYEESAPFEFLVTSFDADDKTITPKSLGLKAYIYFDIVGLALGISYTPEDTSILCTELITEFNSNDNSCAAIYPNEFTTTSWNPFEFDIDFDDVQSIKSADTRTTVVYDDNTGQVTIDTSNISGGSGGVTELNGLTGSVTIQSAIQPEDNNPISFGKVENAIITSYDATKVIDNDTLVLDSKAMKVTLDPSLLQKINEEAWTEYITINGANSDYAALLGTIDFKAGVEFEFLNNVIGGTYDREDTGRSSIIILTGTPVSYIKITTGNAFDCYYRVVPDTNKVEIWNRVAAGGHRYLGYRCRAIESGCWTPVDEITPIAYNALPEDCIQMNDTTETILSFQDTDDGWAAYKDSEEYYVHIDKGQSAYSPDMFINQYDKDNSDITPAKNAKGELTLNTNNTYTKKEIDDKDATTLSTAESYTDTAIGNINTGVLSLITPNDQKPVVLKGNIALTSSNGSVNILGTADINIIDLTTELPSGNYVNATLDNLNGDNSMNIVVGLNTNGTIGVKVSKGIEIINDMPYTGLAVKYDGSTIALNANNQLTLGGSVTTGFNDILNADSQIVGWTAKSQAGSILYSHTDAGTAGPTPVDAYVSSLNGKNGDVVVLVPVDDDVMHINTDTATNNVYITADTYNTIWIDGSFKQVANRISDVEDEIPSTLKITLIAEAAAATTVAGAIAAYSTTVDDAFAAVEGEIGTLTEQVEEIQGKVEEMGTDIETLQTTVDTLKKIQVMVDPEQTQETLEAYGEASEENPLLTKSSLHTIKIKTSLDNTDYLFEYLSSSSENPLLSNSSGALKDLSNITDEDWRSFIENRIEDPIELDDTNHTKLRLKIDEGLAVNQQGFLVVDLSDDCGLEFDTDNALRLNISDEGGLSVGNDNSLAINIADDGGLGINSNNDLRINLEADGALAINDSNELTILTTDGIRINENNLCIYVDPHAALGFDNEDRLTLDIGEGLKFDANDNYKLKVDVDGAGFMKKDFSNYDNSDKTHLAAGVFESFDQTQGDGFYIKADEASNLLKAGLLKTDNSGLGLSQGSVFINTDDKTVEVNQNTVKVKISAAEKNALKANDDGLFVSESGEGTFVKTDGSNITVKGINITKLNDDTYEWKPIADETTLELNEEDNHLQIKEAYAWNLSEVMLFVEAEAKSYVEVTMTEYLKNYKSQAICTKGFPIMLQQNMESVNMSIKYSDGTFTHDKLENYFEQDPTPTNSLVTEQALVDYTRDSLEEGNGISITPDNIKNIIAIKLSETSGLTFDSDVNSLQIDFDDTKLAISKDNNKLTLKDSPLDDTYVKLDASNILLKGLEVYTDHDDPSKQVWEVTNTPFDLSKLYVWCNDKPVSDNFAQTAFKDYLERQDTYVDPLCAQSYADYVLEQSMDNTHLVQSYTNKDWVYGVLRDINGNEKTVDKSLVVTQALIEYVDAVLPEKCVSSLNTLKGDLILQPKANDPDDPDVNPILVINPAANADSKTIELDFDVSKIIDGQTILIDNKTKKIKSTGALRIETYNSVAAFLANWATDFMLIHSIEFTGAASATTTHSEITIDGNGIQYAQGQAYVTVNADTNRIYRIGYQNKTTNEVQILDCVGTSLNGTSSLSVNVGGWTLYLSIQEFNGNATVIHTYNGTGNNTLFGGNTFTVYGESN